MRRLTLFLVLAACSGGTTQPASERLELETIIVATPPLFTFQQVATFEFAANFEPVNFRSRLDGGIEVQTTQEYVIYDLAEGLHVLEVVSVNLDGRRDETPARYQWTVDRTPPQVEITFPPDLSLTNSLSVAVLGRATDDSGIAAVTINNFGAESTDGFATWRANPRYFLMPAEIEVVAIDNAGNSSTTRGPRADVGPAGFVNVTSRSLVVDADDGWAGYFDQSDVVVVDLATGIRANVPSADPFYGPRFARAGMMALSASGLLLFDHHWYNLMELDATTSQRTTLVSQIDPGGDFPNRAPRANEGRLDGLMVADGDTVYIVSGWIGSPLIALDLATGNRREIKDWEDTQPDAMILDGDLVVACGDTNVVLRVDPGTGDTTTLSDDQEPKIADAREMVLDAARNRILVFAVDRRALVAIDRDDGKRSLLRLQRDARFYTRDPGGLALDSVNDRLLLLERSARPSAADFDPLLAIDPEDGTIQPLFAPQESLGSGPRISSFEGAITVKDGQVVVYDDRRNAFLRVDVQTTQRAFVAFLPEDSPTAHDADTSDGFALLAEPAGLALVDFGSGVRTPLPGTPVSQAVRLHPDGTWALAWSGDTLYRIELPAGTPTEISQTGIPDPEATLAVDWTGGRAFAADHTTGSIWSIDLGNGDTTRVHQGTREGLQGSGDLSNPFQLTYDPKRGRILVTDFGNGGTDAVDLTTGGWSPVAGYDRGWGPVPYLPRGAALDAAADRLYVVDRNRLIVIDLTAGDRAIIAR